MGKKGKKFPPDPELEYKRSCSARSGTLCLVQSYRQYVCVSPVRVCVISVYWFWITFIFINIKNEQTLNYTIFSIINLPDIINQACMTLLDEESKFEGNSSGWSLLIINGLLIRSRPQSITPVIQPQPVIQPPPVTPLSLPVSPPPPPIIPPAEAKTVSIWQ
ncbi:uncharacterized protein LOC120350449 [Nilaparvata lugens]|uniref:uncharacterized protein LOC120350449 n=1 Tax=Nilaparvata lugens TaxID=108931 RepID=UPI00193E4872|nr:uncharacterized protein LOC120350449 [Nilaparvata lugens]